MLFQNELAINEAVDEPFEVAETERKRQANGISKQLQTTKRIAAATGDPLPTGGRSPFEGTAQIVDADLETERSEASKFVRPGTEIRRAPLPRQFLTHQCF